MLITPDRFIALKAAVKDEITRRSKGKGAISSTYYGSSYNYSVTPASGKVITTEYLTKNGVPLSQINSNVISNPTSSANRIISGSEGYSPTSSNVNPSTVNTGDIDKMEAAVSFWSKIKYNASSTSASGCKSSCTGLCYGGCWNECTGSCGSDACEGDCYNYCGGCTADCADTCYSSCDNSNCFEDCERTAHPDVGSSDFDLDDYNDSNN